ncbi:MAG: ribosomal-processing cysteine protease Prp [Oscillospiraceae bacterium]|nr:ribosomal-processing cysteine protease Prp [Oscillospiraceae bacterium]MDD4414313.1 ribosomal-processing cysteine protease Prp [Oscillospiraceae bacterium]
MTRSKFYIKQGILTGFELTGHSGAGHSGNDIVCAAVSSAAFMTVNTITEIMGVPAEIIEREGYLKVKLSIGGAKRCQALLEGFHLHLTELQKQYPHNIKVI